jgi:hypothetical protein
MCNCGCNTCETKKPTLMLNENLAPRTILSEGLQYHIDTNKPLTEHLYRAGSRAYFDLFAEARSLYSRGILDFTHEDDLALLKETHLGHYGMFEGKRVPLDFPIELNEQMDIYDDIANMEFGMDYDQLGDNEKEWVRDEIDNMEYSNESLEEKITRIVTEKKKSKKKDNRPIGKPMRSSSGGKAYKVYVRDPKTKKIKTVRFGSGGLRAKINDPKARQAFAKRHKCSTKKDRTKASYWSCRLPRYAKLLGLKSSFSGFW